jgi:hypothetical protein
MARPLEANLFSYSANNPLNFTDPSGQASDWEIDAHALREQQRAQIAAENAKYYGSGCGAAIACMRATTAPSLTAEEIGDSVISFATHLHPLGIIGHIVMAEAEVGLALHDGSPEDLGTGLKHLKEESEIGLVAGALHYAWRVLKPLGAYIVKDIGICFVAGTPIDTDDGAKAIEEVALGERVGPESMECADLRMNDWSEVGLRMVVEDQMGVDELKIRLLRPRAWFERNQVAIGIDIGLELEELRVAGTAHVTDIRPAPKLNPGARCPVTGLVRHISHEVIAVALLGGTKLEVTRHHPLFSEDRNDWVEAGVLLAGERLRTRDGIAWVEEILDGPRGPTEVFNLEIHGEHRYYAGELRILAHNACGRAAGGAADAAQQAPTLVKGLGNITHAGPLKPDVALGAAQRWLGTGYKEIAPGVYRSGDALRQFRMTTSDLVGAHGKLGPHIHFEALDAQGVVLENLHVPVLP